MLSANLVRGTVAVACDEPSSVVVGDEVPQFAAQFLDGVEGMHPEEVFFQGADEAFGDTVALGLADEGR